MLQAEKNQLLQQEGTGHDHDRGSRRSPDQGDTFGRGHPAGDGDHDLRKLVQIDRAVLPVYGVGKTAERPEGLVGLPDLLGNVPAQSGKPLDRRVFSLSNEQQIGHEAALLIDHGQMVLELVGHTGCDAPEKSQSQVMHEPPLVIVHCPSPRMRPPESC
jgi:hypothetical protein